ncbi:MAG: hypothetical protein JHD24_02170, partial [Polynucleobacter sp.]|nr:hypothetical protein [Polynucleobacter sp.]
MSSILKQLLGIKNPVFLQQLMDAMCKPIDPMVSEALLQVGELLDEVSGEFDVKSAEIQAFDQVLREQDAAAISALQTLKLAKSNEVSILNSLWQISSGKPLGSEFSPLLGLKQLQSDTKAALLAIQQLQVQLKYLRHISSAVRKITKERQFGSQSSKEAVSELTEYLLNRRTRSILNQAYER